MNYLIAFFAAITGIGFLGMTVRAIGITIEAAKEGWWDLFFAGLALTHFVAGFTIACFLAAFVFASHPFL